MKKLKKIKKKSKLKTIDKSKFYSATSLVNFIRSDCIVDLIETLNKNNYMIDFEDELRIKKRNLEESSNSNLSNNCSDLITKRRRTSSFDYIVDDGYKFEANIIIKIKEKLIDNNELSKLIELSDVDINIRYERTLKVLLSKSYDIILGSILINESNKTYGYPDLIVSGYWIKKYIINSSINIIGDRSKYYIIDIKSSSINLIGGGEYVSSGLLYDGYKAQIYIYIQAINKI
jgi:hypothetical protein